MKKFFTLFAAVLMAGSMMADDASTTANFSLEASLEFPDSIYAEIVNEGVSVTRTNQSHHWLWGCSPASSLPDSAAVTTWVADFLEGINMPTGAWATWSSKSEECDHVIDFTDERWWNEYNIGSAEILVPGTEYTFWCFCIVPLHGMGVLLGSNIAMIQFTYGQTSTVLENTNAEVKVQKLIENGQMIIICDGKKFNTVGAEL